MLEPAIKHVMKETSIGCRAARNLINREQNIRAKIFLMEKSYPESNEKSLKIYYNNKTIGRRNCLMDIISSQWQAIVCVKGCCHYLSHNQTKKELFLNINELFCYISTQWYDIPSKNSGLTSVVYSMT